MKKSILLVDDDSTNLFTLSLIITKEGFKCYTVDSGTECIRFLEKDLPDLIIIDVMMPDISGTDLCHKIKSDPKTSHIPIVLISGHKITPEDHAFGLEIGADDYLNRPTNKREFIARINAIFRAQNTIIEKRISEPYLFFDQADTAHKSTAFKQEKIKKAHPQKFKKFVEIYKDIINNALEERVHKTDYDIPSKIKKLSYELSVLKAGTRDVIEIHINALNFFLPCESPKKTRFVQDESRILLIELLGFLLNHYRLLN